MRRDSRTALLPKRSGDLFAAYVICPGRVQRFGFTITGIISRPSSAASSSRSAGDLAFLLRVQVYETLQILLQEGRTHARNGDTIAVTELNHRVAMDVGSNRGR